MPYEYLFLQGSQPRFISDLVQQSGDATDRFQALMRRSHDLQVIDTAVCAFN